MDPQISSQPFIVRFYDPKVHSPDTEDRDLNEILQQNDRWFESCHNYVQILFPLPEESMFNYFAPMIERDTFDAFRARPELRAELRRAFVRMLAFYGFDVRAGSSKGSDEKASKDQSNEAAPKDLEAGNETAETDEGRPQATHVSDSAETTTENATDPEKVVIEKAADHQRKFKNWVMRFNHNHLRITRILRSMRVLGLKAEADAFFAALEDVQAEYGKISDTSLMYWRRAVEQPLWIAPDGEKVRWLRDIEED